MKFIQGQNRHQIALFPECLEDYMDTFQPQAYDRMYKEC